MEPEGQAIVASKAFGVSRGAIRQTCRAASLIVQKEFEGPPGTIPLTQGDGGRNLVIVAPIATPPMDPLEPGGSIPTVFQSSIDILAFTLV